VCFKFLLWRLPAVAAVAAGCSGSMMPPRHLNAPSATRIVLLLAFLLRMALLLVVIITNNTGSSPESVRPCGAHQLMRMGIMRATIGVCRTSSRERQCCQQHLKHAGSTRETKTICSM